MNEIKHIVEWGASHRNVRGMVLGGSRANSLAPTDIYSDYDIVTIVEDAGVIHDDRWLTEIDTYLICVHDHYFIGENRVESRLVIFREHLKVDFSFLQLTVLHRLISLGKLPDGLAAGYSVLLDKDCNLEKLPAPGGKAHALSLPDKDQFQRNFSEFWFEVYHVIKYIRRKEPWAMRSRHWAARRLLLEMLQWEHLLKTPGGFAPQQEGRGLSRWLAPDLATRLERSFQLETDEPVRALRETTGLYTAAARNVAGFLKYGYKRTVEEKILTLLETSD